MNITIGQIADLSDGLEAVIPALTKLLKGISGGQYSHLITLSEAVTDFESEEASDIYGGLEEALDNFAPPYCYFGSSPEDVGIVGFYPYPDFRQMLKDDEIPVVPDLAALRDNYTGEALIVNDHGNATFYCIENGQPSEIWVVVMGSLWDRHVRVITLLLAAEIAEDAGD